MGAAKVLGGVIFLALGIFLLIIGIAPIDIIGDISVYTHVELLMGDIYSAMSTMDFTPILEPSGYLSISMIIPTVGYHYCKAGIKSMRYDKPKKEYYYSETKIGFLIAGAVIIVVAAVLVLTFFLEILTPFITNVLGMFGVSVAGFEYLIPTLLVDILVMILIIFLIYWIGSKVMKHGVKKETWNKEPSIIS